MKEIKKMKIAIFALICMFGANTTMAQSDKMEKKAKEQLEELDSQISSVDKSLALSKEQKEQLYTVYLDRLKELKANKNVDKDAKKVINKKYFHKIYNELLTKEQKKARLEAKKKDKKGKK